MALLSPADQQKLRESFAEMTRPVRLLFFTQTLGCETCPQTRWILDELPALSDKIAIEEVNFVLDKDRAAQYGIQDIPAIVLLKNGADTRMRFLGAPAGYEFMSLVEAIILAGTDDSGLSAASKRVIAERVTAPLDLQVFVTPT